MGRIVVSEFVSLDDVFEDPGGAEGYEHGGWTFEFERGEDGDRFKWDELMAADSLLLGRVTYQAFAKAWPSMTDTGEFGEKMNGMRKYVVSSTLQDTDATWNNTVIVRGDMASELARLKRSERGDMLVGGSGQLVRALQKLDLVDEYRLMVFPVILGTGKRLFGDSRAMSPLRLTSSRTTGDGILLLTYEPAKVAAGSPG